ncbi:hypothetical protein [Lentzea aerocolonigenes]|uniref:hypothetical protein n=1 Tax=Lentzea aerocolonigenes TaxID=68170 RepID=UPI0012DE4420|nr:hypothetical protein [Lentzea aerocolonigenes]
MPTGTEFALVHNGEQNIVVKVLGLTDEFLFNGEMYTCEAQELYDSVEEFFEAFNWTHPDDGLDRRFIFSVHLLDEAQQAEREHPSGVFLSSASAAS